MSTSPGSILNDRMYCKNYTIGEFIYIYKFCLYFYVCICKITLQLLQKYYNNLPVSIFCLFKKKFII